MRGPVVYCIEEKDNGSNLQLIRISHNPDFKYEEPFILANGTREKANEELYSEYCKPTEKNCTIKLIPYSMWGNRGENEMSVYIRI